MLEASLFSQDQLVLFYFGGGEGREAKRGLLTTRLLLREGDESEPFMPSLGGGGAVMTDSDDAQSQLQQLF